MTSKIYWFGPEDQPRRYQLAGHTDLFRDGQRLAVTAAVLKVIECLVANAGSIVSNRDIADVISGEGSEVNEQDVAAGYIRKVRNLLGPGEGKIAIRTERGNGYYFAWAVSDKPIASTGFTKIDDSNKSEASIADHLKQLLAIQRRALDDGSVRLSQDSARISLDIQGQDKPQTEGDPKDALTHLHEWLEESDGPSYAVLFGGTGMGKTTTVRKLALDLLEANEIVPVYLDLRFCFYDRRAPLNIETIVDHAIRGTWYSGVQAPLDAREIEQMVRAGALVIVDGLDEVLVHLDSEWDRRSFIQELQRLRPPTRSCGRLLFTCRTQYFRTLRDQLAAFAPRRGSLGSKDYRAFVLRAFTGPQIDEYIQQALPLEEAKHAVSQIHSNSHLTSLAKRPFILRLLVTELWQIGRWRAFRQDLTVAKIYEQIIQSWLERDLSKHTLSPAHKRQLMEHLAAAMWRSGRKSWRINDVEDWLITFLHDESQLLSAHYDDRRETKQLFKEDFRTATFLVRDSQDRFRFAHTSLQEFFLAGYLLRALREDRLADWKLTPVSLETLDFLGQLLHEEPETVAPLAFLRNEYQPQISEIAFDYIVLAGKRNYPAIAAVGFQLLGAQLDGREIANLDLTGANFQGASLIGSKWVNCTLSGANLGSVDARHAEWLECRLESSHWKSARLEGALFRDCRGKWATFEDARFDHTRLLRSDFQGIPMRPPGILLSGLTRPEEVRIQMEDEHDGTITACAWSPEGERLLSASADCTMRIFGAATGESLLTISDHSESVEACCWSPDGKSVLSASGLIMRKWNATTGKVQLTITGHSDSLLACAWSPCGTRLLSGAADHTLRISDATSGVLLLVLLGHTESVKACAWSPDAKRIVSASSDKTLRVWDAVTGLVVLSLSGHTESVNSCAWSPDGMRVVSASSDQTVRVWDTTTGFLMKTLSGHAEDINACAWSPDGKRLVSASRTLRIWDAETGQPLNTISANSERTCGWSNDSTCLVSDFGGSSLRVWDSRKGVALFTTRGYCRPVTACSWSHDGTRFLSGSYGNSPHVYDASTGTPLLTLSGHTDSAPFCSWSPDGTRLLSASDESFRVWDAETGGLILAQTLSNHSSTAIRMSLPASSTGSLTGSVQACEWSPDGSKILLATWDDASHQWPTGTTPNFSFTLAIWDATTGDLLLKIPGCCQINSLSACCWSADGKQILSAEATETMRVYDAVTGEPKIVLVGHSAPVLAAVWSPCGTRILSTSEDGSLRIWDASTGEAIIIIKALWGSKPPSEISPGGSNPLSACAWSPDGALIVSATADFELCIWNAVTGDLICKLPGHSDSVSACAWSPDGLRILSASSDGSVRLWDWQACQESARYIRFVTGDYCSIDPRAQSVVTASADAWRYFHWVFVDHATGNLDCLPAEIFGPLPVRSPPESVEGSDEQLDETWSFVEHLAADFGSDDISEFS